MYENEVKKLVEIMSFIEQYTEQVSENDLKKKFGINHYRLYSRYCLGGAEPFARDTGSKISGEGKHMLTQAGVRELYRLKKELADFKKSEKITNKNSPLFGDISGSKVNINYGKQTINDNSVCYEENRQDTYFLEQNSIWMINNFGEKKPLLAGLIGLLSGIVSLISGLNSLLQQNMFFAWFPSWATVPESAAIPVIVFGIIVLILGVYILALIQYKFDTQCPSCKKHYGLQEVGTPTVRQVEAHDGIKKTTTRSYECKFCDFFKNVPKTETIPYSDEDEYDY